MSFFSLTYLFRCLFQIYILTKDEGGLAQPLPKEKQVLCFSKTWDCASFVDLTGESLSFAHCLLNCGTGVQCQPLNQEVVGLTPSGEGLLLHLPCLNVFHLMLPTG